MNSLTVTAREAAEMLGCSTKSVYAAVAAGHLPNVGLGRSVAIPRHAIAQRFADAGAPLPATELVGAGTFT